MSVADSPDIFVLLEDLLRECHDDHVGLWVVVRRVREFLDSTDREAVRTFTLKLLGFLLKEQLIVAGVPAADGRGFNAWSGDSDEWLKRIAEQWNQLGHEPGLGEVAWFTSK